MDKQEKRNPRKWGVILLWIGLIAFFIYSFQAVMYVEVFGDEIRHQSLMRVLRALAHPNIIEYETEELNVEIPFHLPCPEGDEPALPTVDTNEPYLVASASCGDAFETLTIEGFNMPPFARGPIDFIAYNGIKKQIGLFTTDDIGHFSAEVELPNRQPVEEAQAIRATVRTNIGSPKWSENALSTVKKLWETILMSFLATALSTIFATLFSLLLYKISSGKLRIINILLQPILAMFRSVHPLILAIPAVIYVGIGPMAGVLALTIYATAVLTAKYLEYMQENPTFKLSDLLTIYFPGIAFKELAGIMSIATVVGFVGGGGIGFLLSQNINLLDYRAASTQLIAIAIVVGSLDLLSKFTWK